MSCHSALLDSSEDVPQSMAATEQTGVTTERPSDLPKAPQSIWAFLLDSTTTLGCREELYGVSGRGHREVTVLNPAPVGLLHTQPCLC